MKVSIVTISFNQAHFLERTIQSIIKQDYKNIEYIIVDPGSTDGSREIIERYRDHFAKIIFSPDDGPADGINKGLHCSTGDILGYLNSDDILLPGAIRHVANAFNETPETDLIYGHGYIIDQFDNVLRHFRSDRFNLRRHVHGAGAIMQQSAFFRRQAFIEIGGFNRDNRTCWDGEFWVDLALHGKKMRRVRHYLAGFRIHDASITSRIHLTPGAGNDVFRCDQRRIGGKVFHNEDWSPDPRLKTLMRIEKWMCDPFSFLVRLSDSIPIKPRLPSF